MRGNSNHIYLQKAARKWEDGLPLGNGRLGAMVMGKVNEETIFINEETLWYGPRRSRSNLDGYKHLKEIRELLLQGEVEKAAFLAKMSMTSTPKYNNPFQPAGDLRLYFMNHYGAVTDYKRILDIDNALAQVSYKIDGDYYIREHLVSVEYNVLAIHITSDTNEGITMCVNMSRKPFEENTGIIDEGTVGNWGENGAGGVHYMTGVRMCATSLSGKTDIVKTMGDFIYVENAKEVTIYLAAVTNFIEKISHQEMISNHKDSLKDSLCKTTLHYLDRAAESGYERIKEKHLLRYHKLYDRFFMTINDLAAPMVTTDSMLASVKQGEEKYVDYLIVLLLNYARYLMISSSYECELPANLQGIWNGSYEPPWQSQFTININTEMNYWFVEKVSLPECHLPLFKLLNRMVENGRMTAEKMYGCKGFCAHHNTNLWACTDIEGIFDESPFWVMGGAWLSLHMYEHYLYTGDEKFLKEEALPVMREAITFFQDYLYENESGELLTGPVVSPENKYRSEKGQKGALCMAPTMDSTILRQLISWYLEGIKITAENNEEETKFLTQMMEKLPLLRVGKDGRILEWYQEYEEVEPGHRHISHLYGLHPGNEITQDNLALFEGARRTIEYRLDNGGGHTGWSKAWLACFKARLKEGEGLYQNLVEFLQKCIQDNMLDIHPPFQIDGNFGIAEAILEGIVQSHGGYIELLPSLPTRWRKGRVEGVRLRGAICADISWNHGELEKLVLTAQKECQVQLKYKHKTKRVTLSKHQATEIHL